MLKVELVEDWNRIDGLDDGDIILSVKVNDDYISLDEFIRYDTPWMSEAPKCETKDGESVTISAVRPDMMCPLFIELDGDNVRVWRPTEIWW